jgi:hypothetical protein
LNRQVFQTIRIGHPRCEFEFDEFFQAEVSDARDLHAGLELFPAENALSQIEASRRLAVVQLYKALGGGWSLKDSEWSGASTQISSSQTPTGN